MKGNCGVVSKELSSTVSFQLIQKVNNTHHALLFTCTLNSDSVKSMSSLYKVPETILSIFLKPGQQSDTSKRQFKVGLTVFEIQYHQAITTKRALR